MKAMGTGFIIALAVLLAVPAAWSQAAGDAVQLKRHVVTHAGTGEGVAAHLIAEPGEDLTIGIKVIKGAPYSAQTRSETVQTLANGNRIVRSNSTRIYRDSEGRTRQEYLFGSPDKAASLELVSIHDAVAGVSYTLHPAKKTAEKITHSSHNMVWTDTAGETVAMKSGEGQVFVRRTQAAGGEAPQPMPHASVARDVLIRIPEAGQHKREITSESLGVRVMEGIQVEGTRITTTLPAGAIGNEQPLVTVTETWYSPDLQATIHSKRDDPMAGTTVYQVTGLVRGEPDASLFQLPSDYTVNEAKVNFIHKTMEKTPKKQ